MSNLKHWIIQLPDKGRFVADDLTMSHPVNGTYLVLTDTEAETSIDLDKSVVDLVPSAKPNVTKSFFNITFEDFVTYRRSQEFESYENRLRQELKDWHAFLKKKLDELKYARQKQSPIDISILSEERCAFLKAEPDFQKFLRDIRDFRGPASEFMTNDFIEMLEIKTDLVEVCQESFSSAKRNKVKEMLEDVNIL